MQTGGGCREGVLAGNSREPGADADGGNAEMAAVSHHWPT
jgi:hypothetical protein